MSTLKKLPSGARIITSDRRFNTAQRMARRPTNPLRGLSGLGCPNSGLSGLGGSEGKKQNLSLAAGAASGAAAGAQAGSVVPGIGNAVGAVVGAVLGAAKALLGADNTSSAEKAWDDYKTKGGSVAGRAYDPTYFAQAFKGMWDTNKKGFPNAPGDRQVWLNSLAALLAGALGNGIINLSTPARTIYQQLVVPWSKQNNSGKDITTIPAIQQQIVIDQVDRLMAGLSACGDINAKSKTCDKPIFILPPNAAPPVMQTPASVGSGGALPATNTTLPTVQTPVSPGNTLLPSYPTGLTDPATNALISSLLAQGASQQQTLAAALNQLQSQGVPITAQLQQQVGAQVAAASGLPSWVWLAGGAGALVIVMLMMDKKRR